jgi:hypothetical protein
LHKCRVIRVFSMGVRISGSCPTRITWYHGPMTRCSIRNSFLFVTALNVGCGMANRNTPKQRRYQAAAIIFRMRFFKSTSLAGGQPRWSPGPPSACS